MHNQPRPTSFSSNVFWPLLDPHSIPSRLRRRLWPNSNTLWVKWIRSCWIIRVKRIPKKCHNVNQHALFTYDNLKGVIKKKLSDDIISGDFDVGYVQDTTVVHIRTSEDLEKLWSLLRQPHKSTVLWCDGLIAHAGRKRKHSDDEDDSDTEQQPLRRSRSKKHDNVQQVQDTVDQLKAKYGSRYTQMHFRIWAELIVGGMCGIDGPPSNKELVLETEQVNHVSLRHWQMSLLLLCRQKITRSHSCQHHDLALAAVPN